MGYVRFSAGCLFVDGKEERRMLGAGIEEQTLDTFRQVLEDARAYGWTPSPDFISKCDDHEKVIGEITQHLGRIQAGDGQIRVATQSGQLALVSRCGPGLVQMVRDIGLTPTQPCELRAIHVFRGRKSMTYSEMAPLFNFAAE